MLGDFLFYEENASKQEKSNYINLKVEVRELIRDAFTRRLLAEILLDLQKDVSGDTLKRLFKLYQDLGLHQDAYLKLRSWRWEVVSKGILELTKMQVLDSYPFITRFLNDKRSTIRKQAEIATVTLKHEGINFFLDSTRYRISEWQQLKLLDVIRNFEDFNPPRFKVWLTSKNRDVVLFALRLIKYYKQNDANASITQLVKHKNDQIKTEAINCIKEFCVKEALDTLKNVFWKCRVDIKLLILDTVAALGDEQDLTFLQLVEKKETNFIIKSKALGSINSISPEHVMPVEGMDRHLDTVSWEEEALTLEATSTENNTESEEASILVEDESPMVVETVNQESIILSDSKEEEPEVSYQEESAAEIETTDTITHLEVFAEEVLDTSVKQTMDEIIMEFEMLPEMENDEEVAIELDFLPLVVDCMDEQTCESFDSATDNLPNFEVAFKEVHALEHDEIGTSQNYDEITCPEFDFSPATEVDDEQEPNLPIATNGNDYPETKSVFRKLYFDKDLTNKILLLDTIGDAGDKREVPLLKEIIAHEKNIPLRDNAMEVLNKITGEKYRLTTEDTLLNLEDLKSCSVFKPLFMVGDNNSRLMLLDQIAELGDQKEMIFLDSLLQDPDEQIRDKASEVKQILYEKITGEKPVVDSKIPTTKSDDEHDLMPWLIDMDLASQSKTTNTEKQGSPSENDVDMAFMPLEVSFLLDELEIKPSIPSGVFDIDFELSAASDETKDNLEEIVTTENTFLEQLLALPTKILSKING